MPDIFFGVWPREVLAAHDGLELITRMAKGELAAPPIAETMDFVPVHVAEGIVHFRGDPSLRVYNPIGSVHGGWAATLLDSCMACAVHTTLKAGTGYTTTDLNIKYVRPILEDTGPLTARGKVIKSGRRLAIAEGELIGDDGKLFAHGTTSCMVFPL